MSLSEYFDKTDGTGIFSTSDAEGAVNSAIYGRPGFTDSGEVVFIMTDRRTHANLAANPKAVYLFKEENSYNGKRLYLEKIRETDDEETIKNFKRSPREYRTEKKFAVFFKLTDERPLVGG